MTLLIRTGNRGCVVMKLCRRNLGEINFHGRFRYTLFGYEMNGCRAYRPSHDRELYVTGIDLDFIRISAVISAI